MNENAKTFFTEITKIRKASIQPLSEELQKLIPIYVPHRRTWANNISQIPHMADEETLKKIDTLTKTDLKKIINELEQLKKTSQEKWVVHSRLGIELPGQLQANAILAAIKRIDCQQWDLAITDHESLLGLIQSEGR